MKYIASTAATLLAFVAFTTPANASLGLWKTYVGNYGVSTDGGGSVGQDYVISALVPFGAVVESAYFYQSNYSATGPFAVSFDGNGTVFTAASINASSCCNLNSSRADVTAFVKPIVDVGPGGVYDFKVMESSGFTDGTALVVTYKLGSLPVSTIAILDGFSAVGGDGFSVNFGAGLDPGAAGFQSEMRLGIGFSCCDQTSTVTVNGVTITENAGNNDDGIGTLSNGQLITVGGFDDPFSPFLPAYGDDHERYNLIPRITFGDTAINVRTNNPTTDDNIFLAVFLVSGEATVMPFVPEPATWAMMITGFGLVGFAARRRRSMAASA